MDRQRCAVPDDLVKASLGLRCIGYVGNNETCKTCKDRDGLGHVPLSMPPVVSREQGRSCLGFRLRRLT